MRSPIPSVPPARRPVVTAALVAAVVMAAGLNLAILDHYGKLSWDTPGWLASGLYQYGFGVFDDPPIEPVRLSDTATFHRTCGPECSARRGY